MLPHTFFYWQPPNPRLLIQLKLNSFWIYLLLYLLKKNIRDATTRINSSIPVTTPAINSEFTERDVERDVNIFSGIAKIKK